MVQWFVLSLFLYFPEDKREYIPAGITLAIFFIMALIAMRYFIVISRKEAKKAKELEDKIMKKDTERNS
ncbi:hypothetical protein [Neobacillus terrae]|uniref:hypothetical protein n=1 Tax=Neobacillus terrae TaxID=3034837 RepID=UPI00140E312A|nr:hypothetical protein [Neobacillus terrae]NHM32819.1 hypothetical protein [Neobacillus terrae]